MSLKLLSSEIRRAATLSLVATALAVLAGCLCAAALLFAHNRVQQLSSAALNHQQVWAQLADRLPPLTQGLDHAASLPQFIELHREAFGHLLAQEQTQRQEVDRQVAALRQPLLQALAFIDRGDLNDFQRRDVDPQLRAQVADILSATQPQLSEAEATQRYRALRNAHANGELLYPLAKRVSLASEMLTRGVKPLYFLLCLIAGSMLVGIAAIWRLAMLPALQRIQQSTHELTAQNDRLRRAEEQLQAAQRTARMGYWFLDAGGAALATGHLAEALGLEAAELPTTLEALAALSPGEEASRVLQAYRELRGADGAIEISRSIHRPGREALTVRERVESRSGENGRWIMGTLLDISELAHANEQLSRLERVKVIEALIAGIAHDFKNLLGVIQGNAELARLKPAAAASCNEAILFAARAANAVIQQLQVGPVQGTHEQELIEPLASIQAVAKAVQALKGPVCQVRVSDIRLAPAAPDALLLRANRGLFESALLNLLKNAREAMPAGGLIEVKLSKLQGSEIARTRKVPALKDRPEEFLCVEVQDHGPGMESTVRAHAVEPFYSTKGTGRGVGLWSVHAFMGICQGEMNIDSAPGRGTRVQLFFPVARGPVPRPGPQAPRAETSAARRVLIVEDEPLVAEVLAEQLLLLGLPSLHAKDADAAERLLRGGAAVAAALVDVNLGHGRSGLELMQQLRPEFPQLKVILMSGLATNWHRAAAAQVQGWRFLEKPFEFETLEGALRDLGVLEPA